MAVKRLSLAIFDNKMKIRKRKKMKTGKRGCVCVCEKRAEHRVTMDFYCEENESENGIVKE